MEPHKWFGHSWGAGVCEPSDHMKTPIGERCLYCEEPIIWNSQGVTMQCIGDVKVAVNGVEAYTSAVRAAHLDCFLKRILPHGPECEHCRGLERSAHRSGCHYLTRAEDGNCSCRGFCKAHGGFERGLSGECPECLEEQCRT